MNTIMFIQNIEHSYNVVSRKYTKFVSFFFSWDGECVAGKINADLRSKISDANKRDEHSMYLHIQGKM